MTGGCQGSDAGALQESSSTEKRRMSDCSRGNVENEDTMSQVVSSRSSSCKGGRFSAIPQKILQGWKTMEGDDQIMSLWRSDAD